MDSAILTEAFKKLDILDEAAFDLNSDSEIDDARDFLTDITIDDSIDIIDPDAESEDEVGESFIGKVILECNVCHSKIFEDEEDVSIDEESGAANVGTECPYCFSVDGYSIIGQVAPMGQVRDELEVEEEETVEEDPVDEKQLGEALKKYRKRKLRESRKSRKRLQEASGTNADYLMYCLKNKLISPKDVLMTLIKSADEVAVEDTLLALGLKDKMDETLREAKRTEKKRLKESEDGDDEDILFDAREDLIDYLNSHTDYSWDANEMYDNCAVAESDDDYIEVFVDIDENGQTFYTVDGGTYSTPAEVVENLPELYSYDDDDFDGDFDESCNEGMNGAMKKGECKNDALTEGEEVCPECGKEPCECKEGLHESVSHVDAHYVIKFDTEEEALAARDKLRDRNFACDIYPDNYIEVFGDFASDSTKAAILNELGLSESTLEEDFKDVSITTDDTHMEMTSDENGKVTVTTEPVNNEDDFGDEEMLAPVDMKTKDNLMAEFEPEEDEEEVDVDFDEFDEEGFDELGESYLKKIYENVDSFRTSKVQEQGNGLKIEGLIKFSSGNTRKTSFLFEAKDIDRKGKIRLIGENKEITRGKKAFTITGSMKDKKFMCESLRYNYRAKDENGKSTRLYGTMKRSK